MVGLLLENTTAAEAANNMIALKQRLMQNGFRFGVVVPVLLTDNGGEFSLVDAFENDGDPDWQLAYEAMSRIALTLEDIDLSAKVHSRIQHEDLYSLVETSFIPYGSESGKTAQCIFYVNPP